MDGVGPRPLQKSQGAGHPKACPLTKTRWTDLRATRQFLRELRN
jgi:hypothetical protein